MGLLKNLKQAKEAMRPGAIKLGLEARRAAVSSRIPAGQSLAVSS